VLAGENPLAVELDEFIQQYMRAAQIWLTLGFQSPHQLDAHLQQTVLSLGTYCFGQLATAAGARLLAEATMLRDPFLVKDAEPIYGRRYPQSRLEVIDVKLHYLPLEEQTDLFANRIRRLKQYEFLVRPALSEGELSTDVFPISVRPVTHDPLTGEPHFPDRDHMEELRTILASQSGRSIADLLREQETSLARYTNVIDG
jgi:hypothetical protein